MPQPSSRHLPFIELLLADRINLRRAILLAIFVGTHFSKGPMCAPAFATVKVLADRQDGVACVVMRTPSGVSCHVYLTPATIAVSQFDTG